jgi:hypothetical protein
MLSMFTSSAPSRRGDEEKSSSTPHSDVKSSSQDSLATVTLKLPKTMMSSLVSPTKTYQFRMVSAVSAITASTSATATAKVSWNPTGLSDFSTLTSLFGLYKVISVRFVLWPLNDPTNTSATGGIQWAVCGSDPSGSITGTPTESVVATLPDAHFLSTSNVSSRGLAHKFACHGVQTCVANLAPTKDGYILVGASWPGQFCFVSGSAVSSSATHFQYTTEIVVSMKSRF